MVNPVTQSMVDRIIETKYKGKIAELGYGTDTPLWSLIPKRPDFREETLMLRNRYGLNPSGSHTVATARSRQGASSYARFGLTQSKAYGSVAFDGMTARALVAGNTQRAIDVVSLEVESQAMHFGRRMNRMMYQNHGGSLGIRITSGGNSQTLTVYAAHRERLINVPRAEARKVSKALKSRLAATSKDVGAAEDQIVAAYDDAETLITPKIDAAQKALDEEKARRAAEERGRREVDLARAHGVQYDLIHSHYWLSGVAARSLRAAWGTPFVQMFHTLGHMKERTPRAQGIEEVTNVSA